MINSDFKIHEKLKILMCSACGKVYETRRKEVSSKEFLLRIYNKCGICAHACRWSRPNLRHYKNVCCNCGQKCCVPCEVLFGRVVDENKITRLDEKFTCIECTKPDLRDILWPRHHELILGGKNWEVLILDRFF